jgi:serine/threonine protein kinase
VTSSTSLVENTPASDPELGTLDLVANDGNTLSPGSDSPLATPPIIAGRYRLLRRMAEGGSGHVYEARDTTTLRRCALKLLSKVAASPSFSRRFTIEARTTAQLESDHIVQVLDAGVDEHLRFPYIAMELLRGEDLRDTLKRVGRLAPSVALRLARQAATGLARAHQLGVVHRDVKPANLFLAQRDSGEVCVKVLDFGIAKVKAALELGLELDSGDSYTTVGPLGTPRYMSPEQLQREAQIDARTDVWSLGLVLYEMLTGTPPFPAARSVAELRAAVLGCAPEAISEVAPNVPAELSRLLARALARDPRDRYADAEEFGRALAELVTDSRVSLTELTPFEAPASESQSPPAEPSPPPSSRAEPSVPSERDPTPTLASPETVAQETSADRRGSRAVWFIAASLAVAATLTGLAIYNASAHETTPKPNVAQAPPLATAFVSTTRGARPLTNEAPVNSESQSVETTNLRPPKPLATRPLTNRLLPRTDATPPAKPPSSAASIAAMVPRASSPAVEKEPGRASETLRRPRSDFE